MACPDRTRVTAALRRAAHTLTDVRTVRDPRLMLDDLVRSAVVAVPHARGAAISCTRHGVVRSRHVTAAGLHVLDRAQSAFGEGPCIGPACAEASGVVTAHDLAGDDRGRWPRFAPEAVRAGYRSVVSVRLSPAGDLHTALTLYAGLPGVLGPSAQLTAGLFALQTAALLHGPEHAAHLGHAPGVRDVVGQAKGILMERFVVDDDEAFQVLARSCRDAGLGLVELARWVTRDAADRRERNRLGHPRPASAPVPDPG